MQAVSVVLPTRGSPRYIMEAIQSVLCQTGPSFELIVVDDGLREQARAQIVSLTDPRIQVVRNTEQAGLAGALQVGIARSRGHYIARIDDDDVWTDPTKLARQVSFLDANPDVGLVGCAARLVDEQRRPLSRLSYPTTDVKLRQQMLKRNQFVHASVMIRREVLRKAGGYDPERRRSQDYDLWLRVGCITKLANLPQVMVDVRQHHQAVSYQHHREQFWAFISAVWAHRHSYPNFIQWLPTYAIEAALNMLPLAVRYGWRKIRT